MPKVVDRSLFLSAVTKEYGLIKTITRKEVLSLCAKKRLDTPNWLFNEKQYRTGERGVYSLSPSGSVQYKSKEAKLAQPVSAPVSSIVPTASAPIESVSQLDMAALTAVQLNNGVVQSLIPEKATGYVPFGHYSDVKTIIKSGKFYPMFITGLSGNGKTTMVEQICATEKREMARVNITIETDEDDLIGGFRLVDGRTVWQNGPVIVAMERGAILLLDEVDLGSNKIMCLQPVLEGKPIYLKKINKVITPMPGFSVVATANTKGKGSEDGRFIGTNVLNEAFLERFSITLEQEYPNTKTEEKILLNVLAKNNLSSDKEQDFVAKLVLWADSTRKSFYSTAASELISTRRLVHICEAYAIFNCNRMKAIELCLNRFDADVKKSFMMLYEKLDESINPAATGSAPALDAQMLDNLLK